MICGELDNSGEGPRAACNEVKSKGVVVCALTGEADLFWKNSDASLITSVET